MIVWNSRIQWLAVPDSCLNNATVVSHHLYITRRSTKSWCSPYCPPYCPNLNGTAAENPRALFMLRHYPCMQQQKTKALFYCGRNCAVAFFIKNDPTYITAPPPAIHVAVYIKAVLQIILSCRRCGFCC